MPSPRLRINRVRVDGRLSCDYRLSDGLNAFTSASDGTADPRSSNTCGKTTLIELIRCGLGRNYQGYSDFAELTALRGDVHHLWLELEINGEVLTCSRSLDNLTGRLKIHWLPLDLALADTGGEALAPEELSDVLLEKLGIPRVDVKRGDGSLEAMSFQLLRSAFILHQEDSFFGVMYKVIPEVRRTQIIGLLTGITSLRAFELERALAAIQVRMQELQMRVDAVGTFLTEHGVRSLVDAEAAATSARVSVAAEQRVQSQLQAEIRAAEAGALAERAGRLDSLRRRTLELQAEVATRAQELSQLGDHESELVDLLGSLAIDRKKLDRLRATAEVLSSIEFDVCPRCLSGVTREMKAREELGRCQLCARPIGRTSEAHPRAVPADDELQQQTTETRQLLDRTRDHLLSTRREQDAAKERLRALSAELDVAVRDYVSPSLDKLSEQADRIAVAMARVARADQLLEQMRALEASREHLAQSVEEFTQTKGALDSARAASAEKLRMLSRSYEAILREVDWRDLETVEVSPKTLMPLINGVPIDGLGTGMKGLAVVCFHLAMMRMAVSQETLMPTFLAIDSPGVGGLNERNYDALLRYLVRIAAGADAGDWQIILTTRRSIPGMERFTRKRLRSPDRMLLAEGGATNDDVPAPIHEADVEQERSERQGGDNDLHPGG